jgi:hypothetical protein
MLAHRPGKEPHLAVALRTAQDVLRQKIAQGDVCRYGVVLAGTEKKADNVRKADHIHTLLPMDTPSVGAIRTLQGLADDLDGLAAEFGQSTKFPVQHVISVAMDLFRQATKDR